MYKKLGILAIAGMLLLTMGVADGVAAYSHREVTNIMNIPAVLGANNSENHLVPGVTPPDTGTWGYLGDFTIQGTVISKFDRIGAWGWTVHVDKVVEGPPEMKDKTISVYLTSADPTVYPRGTMDSNINVGDIVEAYGGPASGYDISLTGSANYYLKYLGLPVTADHGAAPRGMGKVISNTTVVSPTAGPQALPALGSQKAPTTNPPPDGVYTISVQNGAISSITFNGVTLYDSSNQRLTESAPADATRVHTNEPYNPNGPPYVPSPPPHNNLSQTLINLMNLLGDTGDYFKGGGL